MHPTIEIHHQNFVLHPSGGVFWEEQSMLLIADVHLGKVAHFRKHGAAIPPHLAYGNLERLTEVTNQFHPQTVCFLGDLFHSNLNTEWDDFASWVAYIKSKVVLVTGNHDIIPTYLYEELGVQIHGSWTLDPFLLTHHPTKAKSVFNFCGHIHPGVRLRGTGRQSLKLPCFFKTEHQMILPAFGNFTGKYVLTPSQNDAVYVIADGEVVQVSV